MTTPPYKGKGGSGGGGGGENPPTSSGDYGNPNFNPGVGSKNVEAGGHTVVVDSYGSGNIIGGYGSGGQVQSVRVGNQYQNVIVPPAQTGVGVIAQAAGAQTMAQAQTVNLDQAAAAEQARLAAKYPGYVPTESGAYNIKQNILNYHTPTSPMVRGVNPDTGEIIPSEIARMGMTPESEARYTAQLQLAGMRYPSYSGPRPSQGDPLGLGAAMAAIPGYVEKNTAGYVNYPVAFGGGQFTVKQQEAMNAGYTGYMTHGNVFGGGMGGERVAESVTSIYGFDKYGKPLGITGVPAIEVGFGKLADRYAARQESGRTGLPQVTYDFSGIKGNIPTSELGKIPQGLKVNIPEGSSMTPGSFKYDETTGKATWSETKPIAMSKEEQAWRQSDEGRKIQFNLNKDDLIKMGLGNVVFSQSLEGQKDQFATFSTTTTSTQSQSMSIPLSMGLGSDILNIPFVQSQVKMGIAASGGVLPEGFKVQSLDIGPSGVSYAISPDMARYDQDLARTAEMFKTKPILNVPIIYGKFQNATKGGVADVLDYFGAKDLGSRVRNTEYQTSANVADVINYFKMPVIEGGLSALRNTEFQRRIDLAQAKTPEEIAQAQQKYSNQIEFITSPNFFVPQGITPFLGKLETKAVSTIPFVGKQLAEKYEPIWTKEQGGVKISWEENVKNAIENPTLRNISNIGSKYTDSQDVLAAPKEAAYRIAHGDIPYIDVEMSPASSGAIYIGGGIAATVMPALKAPSVLAGLWAAGTGTAEYLGFTAVQTEAVKAGVPEGIAFVGGLATGVGIKGLSNIGREGVASQFEHEQFDINSGKKMGRVGFGIKTEEFMRGEIPITSSKIVPKYVGYGGTLDSLTQSIEKLKIPEQGSIGGEMPIRFGFKDVFGYKKYGDFTPTQLSRLTIEGAGLGKSISLEGAEKSWIRTTEVDSSGIGLEKTQVPIKETAGIGIVFDENGMRLSKGSSIGTQREVARVRYTGVGYADDKLVANIYGGILKETKPEISFFIGKDYLNLYREWVENPKGLFETPTLKDADIGLNIRGSYNEFSNRITLNEFLFQKQALENVLGVGAKIEDIKDTITGQKVLNEFDRLKSDTLTHETQHAIDYQRGIESTNPWFHASDFKKFVNEFDYLKNSRDRFVQEIRARESTITMSDRFKYLLDKNTELGFLEKLKEGKKALLYEQSGNWIDADSYNLHPSFSEKEMFYSSYDYAKQADKYLKTNEKGQPSYGKMRSGAEGELSSDLSLDENIKLNSLPRYGRSIFNPKEYIPSTLYKDQVSLSLNDHVFDPSMMKEGLGSSVKSNINFYKLRASSMSQVFGERAGEQELTGMNIIKSTTFNADKTRSWGRLNIFGKIEELKTNELGFAIGGGKVKLKINAIRPYDETFVRSNIGKDFEGGEGVGEVSGGGGGQQTLQLQMKDIGETYGRKYSTAAAAQSSVDAATRAYQASSYSYGGRTIAAGGLVSLPKSTGEGITRQMSFNMPKSEQILVNMPKQTQYNLPKTVLATQNLQTNLDQQILRTASVLTNSQQYLQKNDIISKLSSDLGQSQMQLQKQDSFLMKTDYNLTKDIGIKIPIFSFPGGNFDWLKGSPPIGGGGDESFRAGRRSIFSTRKNPLIESEDLLDMIYGKKKNKKRRKK